MVTNTDMIKQIAIKNSNNFTDTQVIKSKSRYLQDTFLQKTGHEWKEGRNRVSPVFTTKKIRDIFMHFEKASKSLFVNIDSMIAEGKQDEIDVKDLLKSYQLDVIAKFVYAIELNSAKEPNHPFVQSARNLVKFNFGYMTFILNFLPKQVIEYFDFEIVDYTATEWLVSFS